MRLGTHQKCHRFYDIFVVSRPELDEKNVIFIAIIKVFLRVTIRRVIANDTTGTINLLFLPSRTLVVNQSFFELYFSQGPLLGNPSACRAEAHQRPPGELNRTTISVYYK